MATRLSIYESNLDSASQALGSGRYRICIIRPGQGSSGMYLAENLEKSAPLFAAGTQMYLDHPTESEEWERPERSVRDLAAKFISDAEVGEDGALYADIQVYSSFDPIIREKWEDIGVSINAWSYGIMGPNEEIPPFDGVISVDFVTKAGAGGAILELLESARAQKVEEDTLDEEKFNAFAEEVKSKLDEVIEKLDELASEEPEEETPAEKKESASLTDVLSIVSQIAEAGLPKDAESRVIKMVESGVDVEEAITNEQVYVNAITESVRVSPADDVEVKEAAPVSAFSRTRKVK